ncbi:MAG: UvrD-helicase domain-containing protein [Rikenellaceae bacterium]
MRAQIFNASAGSGKTYRLAYKYVRDVINEPLQYRHILAVTFTNKATEEMKSRILREIDTLASGSMSPYMDELCTELQLSQEIIRHRAKKARGYILHDYSRFTVLTIDTFFQRILRGFIQELGLDLNYNIEIESSSILDQSADSLIEQITTDDDLRQWLLEFIQERVDDGKRWDIHDGILSLSRELLCEANRDTLSKSLSKTKIKDIVSSAVERSKKSKEEYASLGKRALEIISNAGCTPSDFAGKSRSFAYHFERVAKGETKAPTQTIRNMSETTTGWCAKGSPAVSIVGVLQPILSELVGWYDRDIKLWNTANLVRENYRSFALLNDLYQRVKAICDQQGMMLLSETKLILSEFIKGNDAPFIYEKTGNRYERFMIDEFQDTSHKEWQNFLPLLQNSMSQSEDSTVLIVGDIKQSIYRWRGGDWRILHSEALDALGRESTEVITLQDNFRSLPLVVEFNNSIIEEVVESENNHLNGLIEEAKSRGITQQCYIELKDMLRDAYDCHAQNPRKKNEAQGFVQVSTYTHTPPLIETIQEVLDRGFSPSDIMILNRSNTDGVKVANMLLEFKEQNEDPRYRFDIMTQEALIVGNSPVSCFIVANMKLALNEGDMTQLAIYNHFLGSNHFDQPLDEEALEMLRVMRLKSLEEVFEQIVMYHHLDQNKDNIAYLQAIHEQLISYSATRIGDIALFVKWWEEQGFKKSLSVERSESAIEITTIHKAKGLEKRVVIIPYCNWSLNPKSSGDVANIVWAEGDEEVEELGRFPVRFKSAMGESRFSQEYYREMVYSHIDNVNLLYVALTRAVESLYIFVPHSYEKSKTIEPKYTKIGDVLLAPLDSGGDEVTIGASLQGVITDYGESKTITFGEPSPPITKGEGDQGVKLHIMDRYPTSKCDLRLRLPSARYTEDSEGVVDPRHIGILMHKTFEEATSREDIFERLDVMRLNGHISSSEYNTLTEGIEKVLNDPLVEGWFSGEWDDVRNENDIIMVQTSEVRRPDRVMIRGDRAVVVDYKFGEGRPSSHQRQVRGYMKLLLEMGYNSVEGYVWYIKSGDIVRV